MNFRLLGGLAAIICVSLASCYPYNENAGKKKPVKGAEKTLTAEEQAKLKEQEAKKKAEEEKKKAEEKAKLNADGTPGTGESTTPGGTTPTTPGPKPEEPKRDYATADKVPGKEGFVISPYNNKVVDVRDIPSGTLVADPTFPPSEKKYFRVP